MKTILKIVKLIGGLMISIGSAALVKNILVMVTPPCAKVAIRICMMVSGYFLGGLAAKAAAEAFEIAVDKTVDKTVNSIKSSDEVEKLIKEIILETELSEGT